MAYDEDDYLMLSGIQHYYFCKRQWALIHIEQQWSENEATALGQVLHQKADNPAIKEKRKDVIISRAIHVASKELGLSGILDVLELRRSESGVKIPGHTGRWRPEVVEYKRGKPKNDLRDVMQLVAQTMCLEETLNCRIDQGTLYYHSVNQRAKVSMTTELRQLAKQLADDMHDQYNQHRVPPAEYFKNCRLCSLVDICMPRLSKRGRSVERYIANALQIGEKE